MADTLTIKANWNWQEAKALMRKLSGPRLHQAMSVAVNDTSRQVEKRAEQLVAKTLGVPAKRAKQGIWVRPYSTPTTLTAVVRGSGSEIPLKAFSAKEEGAGVSAKIWGRTEIYHGSFIFGGDEQEHNRPLGMGDNVFHRVGSTWLKNSKRGPIEKSPGASIGEAMAKDAVSEINQTYGVERLQSNVLRQLERYSRVRTGGTRAKGKRAK